MDFSEYQLESRKFAIYPGQDDNYIYPVLGLVGESGEVAEKMKKILRDNDGIVDEEKLLEIAAELGDVLWYLSQLCTELGIGFGDVAKWNIQKLTGRASKGALHGNGDKR